MPTNVVSHYTIIEKLGEGGMGVVYKAHDTSLDRFVALKFLPHYLTSDPAERKRFYHEARAAAALMHPNIAVIHEIGESDGQAFLAMEYVDGKTLKGVLAQEGASLTVEKVLSIARQIGEGLAAAHEKGVIHRDIKSDNIMLTSKGQVKLMDFGLAKLEGGSRLTQAGSTLGTAAYMSPEQARSEDADQRSDIFSFGVVLYELLTNHLPFRGEHREALLYALLNEEPQPIARYKEGVSQNLARIVHKALAKDREERYQHVDDLLADMRSEQKKLEVGQTAGAQSATGSTRLPSVRKTHGEKPPWRIIIPVAAVGMLALLFFLLKPFTSSPVPRPGPGGASLAVMYFEDIPDPEDRSHTGEMLTSLLISSLSQVQGLEVISRERLLDVQNDLGHPATKSLSPTLAEQVAKRAGVTTMLTGSILSQTPTLAVTGSLIDVQTGRVTDSHQILHFSADQIFTLVDSLSHLLRRSLQGTLSSTAEIKPVSDVTSASPEAYRAYAEGLDLLDKFYWKEASAAFARAIELDGNFAMAYYYSALTLGALGNVAGAQAMIKKAVDLASHVTDRERLWILSEKSTLYDDPHEAVPVFQHLIDRYPHEINAYIQLGGRYLLYFLEPDKCVGVLLQGLHIEPSSRQLWNSLALSYATLNKREEALAAVNKYVALAPGEPNPYDTRGDVYAWFMQYDSSRLSYQTALALRGDFASAYKLGFHALLRERYDDAQRYFRAAGSQFETLEAFRGKFQSAGQKLKESSEFPIAQYLPASAYREVVMLEYAYEKGQYPEMLRLAIQFSEELKQNPSYRYYGRDRLAWALALNGRSAEAHRLLDELRKDVENVSPVLRCITYYASALVAFEEKEYGRALGQFERIMQTLPPNHEPNIYYGVTLLKTGKTAEAVAELRRVAYWPRNDELYFLGGVPGAELEWPIPAVKAHYWLGVAYEKLGEKEKAREEYHTFTEIWKEADFASPELADARSRIANQR